MVVKHGRFGTAPLEVVTSRKKVVNVARDYDVERLRPTYANFEGRSLFHITAEEE
jgi:ATP-dependent phosphofructokinase / diphosphate-dependent phosphofructokinase